MAKPCNHTEDMTPGFPYEKGTCRLCWLYANNARYRRLWSEEGGMPVDQATFRGQPTFRECNCPQRQRGAAVPD